MSAGYQTCHRRRDGLATPDVEHIAACEDDRDRATHAVGSVPERRGTRGIGRDRSATNAPSNVGTGG